MVKTRRKREVQASVKDERLIQKRRDQIINGAVALIKEKGYHRMTTREIARASGFSIGTLYEYIRTKEDVLYLVCDRIYDQVSDRLQIIIDTELGSIEGVRHAIAHFFRVMDEMQDEVLIMYQELKSLTKDALAYVLEKELLLVELFRKMLERCVENKELKLNEAQIKMAAHNIYVQGQMWGFRRWVLGKMYTLEEYIELQTSFFLEGLQVEKSNQLN
ncbi:TetR/AcrR family transcriptional regulator [Bacillus benzoevorans]|uniref:AcrR family transcriptional regulator n=1 Tax=Bacillus benzoevorans TaxID=1456 RepID=A0A7X0HRE6_9BACI|nr:TetR/AcrR family transcriptional regulator [Bacillus benzoevorans]MBB6445545.1 AcrR family transcriptional regulator [Bacillus benzoevorans]